MGLQAKTIKSVLRRKVDAWLLTIKDEDVRKLAAANTIVTGGCIASMLLGEAVNDFDLYFRTHETAKALAMYYVGKFNTSSTAKFKDGKRKIAVSVRDDDGRIKIVVKSAGIASEGESSGYQYFEQLDPSSDAASKYVDDIADAAEQAENAKGEKFRPVFLSTNAITLSDKVQLVTRFYGEPDDIHQNYDFAHVTNYWSSWDSHLELRPAALLALIERRLIYQGSLYPICSIIRTRKFIGRGWHINAGQYLKMCMQVSELDLSDVDVLEEQLTGVDAAYFEKLIGSLRKHMKDNGTDTVDRTYIMQVIDKIF